MAGIEAFIGSWREETKEGFDEMAGALGLPSEKKEFFKQAKTEISYEREGDEWIITVGMQGVPNNRTFRFKLGEPYKSASIDGSPMNSKMTANGDTFEENHTDEGMNGLEMAIVRNIVGDKMIVKTKVVTKVGTLEMESQYGRI